MLNEVGVRENNRELKQLRRRPQWQLQKTICLMSKTTALLVHHAFCKFLWLPLHDYRRPPSLRKEREKREKRFFSDFFWGRGDVYAQATPLRRDTSADATFYRGTWTHHDEFSFLFLNLNIKVLKNSTPGKVAYIWHIERVQIYAIKFERTQIHFLATFSLPSSSSLLAPLMFLW